MLPPRAGRPGSANPGLDDSIPLGLRRDAHGLSSEDVEEPGKRRLTGVGMTRKLTRMRDEIAYDELCGYTLTLGDVTFIHQHVVDAYAAQNADEGTKPIKVTFALVGLYLHVEKGFTGKQVQRAHQFLVRRKRVWPAFALPRDRGAMSASDVIAQPAGEKRDAAIHAWCVCVWEAFRDCHSTVAALLRSLQVPVGEPPTGTGESPVPPGI